MGTGGYFLPRTPLGILFSDRRCVPPQGKGRKRERENISSAERGGPASTLGLIETPCCSSPGVFYLEGGERFEAYRSAEREWNKGGNSIARSVREKVNRGKEEMVLKELTKPKSRGPSRERVYWERKKKSALPTFR